VNVLLWGAVAAALVFDFTNGAHDTANAVATSVSTRALSPRVAVLVAAVANFAGALVSTAVATTVATDIVHADLVTTRTLLAALIGATAWNLVTWWLGLPSSSSHALIGGLIGAAMAAAGPDGVDWGGVVGNFAIPAVLSPILGFALAFVLMLALMWAFARTRPAPLHRWFRLAQVASGTFMAFVHGANDAQKTMGVIVLALFAEGRLSTLEVPTWVVLASGTTMALGTYAGGWRIIRTLGMRVFRLDPPHGFAAQTAASGVLLATAQLGFPVSTTHVISGAVIGVGSTRRLSAVRWGVAGNIALAWVITLPAAALVAAAVYGLLSLG
jgi:PiT family inorganic phosphate transporter